MFHAVIMLFRFFLGKFSFKQTAIISRYTSAFQRELHDYFSLSLNKNQNQHPKHRAKKSMEKKKLFCWENDDYGQSLALSFRSWVSLHHHTKLSSGLQRVFFLILILMSAPLIPLPIKNPTFIMTLCFWM